MLGGKVLGFVFKQCGVIFLKGLSCKEIVILCVKVNVLWDMGR